jgi:hypothetical protein
MKPLALKALKVVGIAWCVVVVGGYAAMWLFSEHGGGLFSQGGWGEMWLIFIACAPGVGLMKLSDRLAGPKTEQQQTAR